VEAGELMGAARSGISLRLRSGAGSGANSRHEQVLLDMIGEKLGHRLCYHHHGSGRAVLPFEGV
jgi:hypothetical protein